MFYWVFYTPLVTVTQSWKTVELLEQQKKGTIVKWWWFTVRKRQILNDFTLKRSSNSLITGLVNLPKEKEYI